MANPSGQGGADRMAYGTFVLPLYVDAFAIGGWACKHITYQLFLLVVTSF